MMQLGQAVSPERLTVALVQERDGREAAVDYARRCMIQYRRAVLTSTRGNLFYLRWVRSYQEFKRIVIENA